MGQRTGAPDQFGFHSRVNRAVRVMIRRKRAIETRILCDGLLRLDPAGLAAEVLGVIPEA